MRSCCWLNTDPLNGNYVDNWKINIELRSYLQQKYSIIYSHGNNRIAYAIINAHFFITL